MITEYTEMGVVIDKIYRDLDINEELNESSLIEWLAEALLFIGAFGQHQVLTTKLAVENHRAKLPCGFYRFSEPPTFNNTVLHYAGNSQVGSYWCDSCRIPTCCTEYSFYINDTYFHTSIESGDVCLTYIGIPLDTNGIPKIPNDIYYLEAGKSYVVKMLDWQKWRKGQIPDKVKDDSEARWNFYVQAARGSANMPDLSQLESIKNTMIRLIPQQNQYNNMFKGGAEKRFIQ